MNDGILVIAASATVAFVLIGGVYYLVPSWSALPEQSEVEESLANYASLPINIAARMGSNLGSGIMKASGYTFTATELQQVRPALFAQANIPNTPANTAQTLHEIMASPGQLQKLNTTRTNSLGTNSEWNLAVSAAFYPMYGIQLEDAIMAYVSASTT